MKVGFSRSPTGARTRFRFDSIYFNCPAPARKRYRLSTSKLSFQRNCFAIAPYEPTRIVWSCGGGGCCAAFNAEILSSEIIRLRLLFSGLLSYRPNVQRHLYVSRVPTENKKVKIFADPSRAREFMRSFVEFIAAAIKGDDSSSSHQLAKERLAGWSNDSVWCSPWDIKSNCTWRSKEEKKDQRTWDSMVTGVLSNVGDSTGKKIWQKFMV